MTCTHSARGVDIVAANGDRSVVRVADVAVAVLVHDAADHHRGHGGIGARRAQASATVTRMGRDRRRARFGRRPNRARVEDDARQGHSQVPEYRDPFSC